jgi:hypothetical protein
VESEIAADLNARGIVTDFGRAWTRGTVHEVLTNEKYIGNNVYHRTSFKLKRKHVVNPPDRWIRAEGVFEGIVEPEVFLNVREIVLARSQRLTDDEMLEKLRGVLKQHGRLSGIIIDESAGAQEPDQRRGPGKHVQAREPAPKAVGEEGARLRGEVAVRGDGVRKAAGG